MISLFGDGDGGDEGARTPGLIHAKDALSQLSYVPIRNTVAIIDYVGGRVKKIGSDKMKYRAPKGTRDILPDEAAVWSHIEALFRHAATI